MVHDRRHINITGYYLLTEGQGLLLTASTSRFGRKLKVKLDFKYNLGIVASQGTHIRPSRGLGTG